MWLPGRLQHNHQRFIYICYICTTYTRASAYYTRNTHHCLASLSSRALLLLTSGVNKICWSRLPKRTEGYILFHLYKNKKTNIYIYKKKFYHFWDLPLIYICVYRKRKRLLGIIRMFTKIAVSAFVSPKGNIYCMNWKMIEGIFFLWITEQIV